MVFEKRKLAFVELAEAGEQPLADQPAKDRISEELEPFVIGARSLRGRELETRLVGARELCVTERAKSWRSGRSDSRGRLEFVADSIAGLTSLWPARRASCRSRAMFLICAGTSGASIALSNHDNRLIRLLLREQRAAQCES